MALYPPCFKRYIEYRALISFYRKESTLPIRVPLQIILGSLAGRIEIDEIVQEYDLQKEDVLAALAYAARVIAGEEITAYAQA
jgi:hypothetical protein